MIPLSQLFTPTPQHNADIEADPIFQEMNHSHLTPAYTTRNPPHNMQPTTPNALRATVATPGYFLDDVGTPAYFYEQNSDAASPPYFCDSAPCGHESPRAYEDKWEVMRSDEFRPAENLPVDAAIEVSPTASSPEEAKDVSSLRPIVLKTIRSKKKIKKAEPESDVTCTVEVLTWSWFMNLPLKLRNRIYSYYFFPEGKDWAPRPTFGLNNTWCLKTPALLQSDPYIRNEAITIYYSELKTSVASPEEHLVPWLKTLDEKARIALSDITIAYDGEDSSKMTAQVRKVRCIDRCCKVLEARGVRVKRAAISGVYMGGGNWL